jgi:protein-disulfide isomerase
MPGRRFNELLPVKLLALVSIIASPAAFAQDGNETAFTKAEDKAIGNKIKSYLNDNPEVIINAIKKYRQDQRRKQRQQANKNVEKYLDELTNPAKNPSVGAQDPAVTIVEFMDYNCGYCKKALDGVQKVLKNRDDVRFVFQDVAVLGPSSDEAARWALAAEKQGQYFAYHVALMQHKGKKTRDTLRNIAKEIGLDVDKLEKDAQDPAIKQALKRNQEIMQGIGIRGTPGFVINGDVYRGFMPYSKLKQRIEKAAEQG